jgi:hypothetical protein
VSFGQHNDRIHTTFELSGTAARVRCCEWTTLTEAWLDDAPAVRAAYSSKTADEIRQIARQSRNPEVRLELRDLAVHFDRMAISLAGKHRKADPAGR